MATHLFYPLIREPLWNTRSVLCGDYRHPGNPHGCCQEQRVTSSCFGVRTLSAHRGLWLPIHLCSVWSTSC